MTKRKSFHNPTANFQDTPPHSRYDYPQQYNQTNAVQDHSRSGFGNFPPILDLKIFNNKGNIKSGNVKGY